MITQFTGSVQFQSKIDEFFDFFYLIQRITNQNILGRFLLQLQVQMKTSLEVINMNATYVRSQHIVDFQRNAMPL